MSNHFTNRLPNIYRNIKIRTMVGRRGRRETWPETVTRFMENIVQPHLDDSKMYTKIEEAILTLQVMPSMRALMTAGQAADRDNTCVYNCSYLPVDHPRAFDEAMFIFCVAQVLGLVLSVKLSRSCHSSEDLFEMEMLSWWR